MLAIVQTVIINEIAWPVNVAEATNGLKMGTVVINEIAWMGTLTSANDEWIELANNTEAPVDLSGWKLAAEDGSPVISLAGSISAKGYAILERTDDQSAQDVKALVVYTGALENKGENLKMYDSKGILVDEVLAEKGWPAGDNKTRQTMERTASGWPASNASRSDAGWQTSFNAGGTPGQENSAILRDVKKLDLPWRSSFMVGTPLFPSHFAIAMILAASCSLLILGLKRLIARLTLSSSDALED